MFDYEVKTGAQGEPIVVAKELEFEDVTKIAKERLSKQTERAIDKVSLSLKEEITEKMLIDFLTSGPVTGDHPLENDPASMDNRIKKLNDDVREDLKISRVVTRSLIDQLYTEIANKKASNKILEEAIVREHDLSVLLVNVTGNSPREAAKRTLEVKERYPELEVEPVDITDVFKDVKPLAEVHIDVLSSHMCLQKPTDVNNLPDRIKFAIPDQDISATIAATGGEYVPMSDVAFETVEYVLIDSMPSELADVIRAYLAAKRTQNVNYFKKRVKELAEKTELLPSTDPLASMK